MKTLPATRRPATPPIPGRLTIGPGRYGDYKTLAHLHYRPGDPRCPVGVLKATHALDGTTRTVGVLVTCYPALRCLPRESVIGDAALDPDFVNAHVRVIRRVIVHPQFRGLGLASALVRHAVASAETRYTEAIAVMGGLVPMFDRGGLTRVPTAAGSPAYFLHDGGEVRHV